MSSPSVDDILTHGKLRKVSLVEWNKFGGQQISIFWVNRETRKN